MQKPSSTRTEELSIVFECGCTSNTGRLELQSAFEAIRDRPASTPEWITGRPILELLPLWGLKNYPGDRILIEAGSMKLALCRRHQGALESSERGQRNSLIDDILAYITSLGTALRGELTKSLVDGW